MVWKQCSEDFLKYEGDPNESPNNGRHRVPTHLLSSNKASRTGTGLHSIELLVKVSNGSPQTTQVAKTVGGSL